MIACPKEKNKQYNYHCFDCTNLNRCDKLFLYILKLKKEKTESNLQVRLLNAHRTSCHVCKDLLIENQKLAIEFWKDAWYEQRSATGNYGSKLYFTTHHKPVYIKPFGYKNKFSINDNVIVYKNIPAMNLIQGMSAKIIKIIHNTPDPDWWFYQIKMDNLLNTIQCEALNAVHPLATNKERRCENITGAFEFNGSYGPKRLCDKHAKSYKEFGYELDVYTEVVEGKNLSAKL